MVSYYVILKKHMVSQRYLLIFCVIWKKYVRVEWTIAGDLLRDTRLERHLKEEVWQSGVDYSSW